MCARGGRGGLSTAGVPLSRSGSLLPDDLLAGRGLRMVAAGVQVVVMEGRVQEEHETAVRLVPPHRVVAEEDDVPFAQWHVDDRGRPREL